MIENSKLQTENNRACASSFNSLLFELSERGYSNNSIMNGILFALALHVINSRFMLKEVFSQLENLHDMIKKQLPEDDSDDDIFIVEPKNPSEIPWD